MSLGIRKAYKKTKKTGIEQNVDFNNLELTEYADKVIEVYESFYKNYHHNLGHFFRFIYNTVKFVIENFEKEDDRLKYIGILQSQLSNDELGLIFFNCISKFSKNSDGKYQFHDWIDKYQLFQNIDSQSILDENYVEFYPNTEFKFLKLDSAK